jgi:hypothetical protein
VNFKYKIQLTIWIFLSTISFSQSVKDSLNFSQTNYLGKLFSTSLEKRLNTYNLNSRLSYSYNFDNFFVGIDEDYFSSLVNSTEKSIKDEQSLSVIGEYELSPIFQFGTLTQSNIYSNDRKIAINEASNIYSTFYSKISPTDQIKIIPFLGYSINQQVGEDDRGAIYGTNLEFDKYRFNEFLFDAKMKYQKEDIAPRKNEHQLAAMRVRNNLDLGITNIVSANYSNIRKDFYFDTDSLTSSIFNINKNIQSRIEKKYFVEERLYNSRFASDFFFDLSGSMSLRDIDRNTKFKNLSNISSSTFDTKIEEFKFDLSGTSEYRSEIFFGRIRIDYSEKEEKHNAKNIDGSNQILFEQRSEQEKKKNNSSEYTTISALGNIAITRKDNVSFSVLHRKLVYNTSSEENFDDRDELLSIFRISYIRTFNHLFNYFLNLEGSLNHIVYIYSERSANNNIRRILKLSSGGEFSGSTFFSRNTFEVSANYSTYDFEDINPNIRSYSFRQFSAKDSSSVSITKKINAEFTGYAKLSEQGDFNWKSFSNNPDRFLAEYYLLPMVSVKKDILKFGVGLRMFILKTYGYNENNFKYLSSDYYSIGPVSNFTLMLQNLNLYFNGWYEFITTEKDIKRELANLTLSISWNL